jgi:D-alanyl-lipoteichoic acid acyltransferase DltB (MBOAT superfamily)
MECLLFLGVRSELFLMSYQSIPFLIFTLVVLVLYYALGRKAQKWLLLAANLVFLYATGWEHIPFLLLSLLVSFLTGRKMGSIYDKADAQLAACQDKAEKKQIRADSKKDAKKFLIIGLIVVIGMLAVIKIAGFAIGAYNEGKKAAQQINFFMPLGISYYTFMAVSYMLDIFWKKAKAEKNIVSYGAFLCFFPHIVQGPIDRYNTVQKSLNEGVGFDFKNITLGIQLAMWGFFKKMVIADRMSVVVNTVFGNHAEYAGSILLIAAIFSAFEMYCNFSGCMDIVRGVAQMMGITLAQNFDRPFFSKGTSEFWRRWHMTLGAFFRDYVYMPISISPKINGLIKTVREKHGVRLSKALGVVIPGAVVWVLTGLWLGTGVNYVAWGIYWFLLTTLSAIFEPEFKKLSQRIHLNTESKVWQVVRMVRTFLLFVISRVLTSVTDLSDSMAIFGGIFSRFNPGALFDGTVFNLGLKPFDFFFGIAMILVLWAVSLLQNKGSIRQMLNKWHIIPRWVIWFALLLIILLLGMYGPGFEASAFTYGKF